MNELIRRFQSESDNVDSTIFEHLTYLQDRMTKSRSKTLVNEKRSTQMIFETDSNESQKKEKKTRSRKRKFKKSNVTHQVSRILHAIASLIDYDA